jgi:hypothetical protein
MSYYTSEVQEVMSGAKIQIIKYLCLKDSFPTTDEALELAEEFFDAACEERSISEY